MTPFTLAAVVTSRDNASPGISKITSHFESLKGAIKSVDPQLEKFSSGMGEITAGAKAMGVGAAGLMLTKSFVNARLEVTQLESDIRSLGMSAEGVEKISLMADKIGVAFGTSREEFLQAGYDIKSGLSSLSDAGVAEYTRLVAVTAAATKGSTAQMADYFGSVANIFKATYKDMSDADMGKMIANQTAAAVQAYKVDGAKIQAAVESVGSAAAATGMKLEEQMAVLGNMGNLGKGAEAGTKLRAFVQNAGEAGAKLGLAFTDTNGHLKSTADIVDLIKAKYGDLSNDLVKREISKAFGTDEALAVVQSLAPVTDKLRSEVTMLAEAGKSVGETGPAFAMAALRTDNAAANLNKLDQGWSALKGAMGKGLENAFAPLTKSAAELAGAVAKFLNEHQGIAKALAFTIALGGAVVFLYGAYRTIRGMAMLYSLAQGALAAATGGAAVTTGGLTGAITACTAAMAANPIGVIVIAVIALALGIYYLVTHWDELKQRFMDAPGWIKAVVVVFALAFLPIMAPIVILVAAIIMLKKHWDTLVSAGEKVVTSFQNTWRSLPGPVRVVLGIIAVLFGGIPGMVAVIIGEWDKLASKVGAVTTFLGDRWSEVKTFLGFDDAVTATAEKKGYDSGKKFGETYAAGIRGSNAKVTAAVESMTGNMSQYLNQSDAKKGALSKTSGYGKSFVQTWGKGVIDESSRTPVPEQFAKVQAKTVADSPMMQKFSAPSSSSSSDSRIGFNAKTLANIVINLSGNDLSIERLSALLAEAIKSDLEKEGYSLAGGMNV